MLFDVVIENMLDTTMIAKMTDRITPGTLKTNRGGISFFVPMGIDEAAIYINNPRIYRVSLTRNGRTSFYRLIKPKLQNYGVFFDGRALDVILEDGEHNRMWDVSGLNQWKVVDDPTISGARSSAMYSVSQQDDVMTISLKPDVPYGSGTEFFSMSFAPDPRNTAQIVGISLAYNFNFTTGWKVIIERMTRGYVFQSTVITLTSTGFNGAPGAICEAFTGCDRLHIKIINDSGSTYTQNVTNLNNEFFVIQKMRVVTSGQNLVGTSVTVKSADVVATPVNQNLNVGTTVNMYAGQEIIIDSGLLDTVDAGPPIRHRRAEIATIIAVLSATTINITLASNHNIGATVRAHYIKDSVIIAAILTEIRVTNSQWLSANLGLCLGTLRDLRNKEYYSSTWDIPLKDLAERIEYKTGINQEGLLYFTPPGQYSRAWSADAIEVELHRPFDVVNSVRVFYTDTNGITQVTAYNTDVSSNLVNRLTRSRTIEGGTVDATTATTIRDLYLADNKDREIESNVKIDYLCDPSGAIYPADVPQEDDTIEIRNLSGIFADPVLRAIPIYEILIDAETGVPSIVPKAPISSLASYLARIGK